MICISQMHRAKTERKKYLNSETKRWCSHQILRQKIIESLQQIRSTGFGILFPGHSRYHQIISMEYESEIKLNHIQLNSIKTKVFPLKYTEKGVTRWKGVFRKVLFDLNDYLKWAKRFKNPSSTTFKQSGSDCTMNALFSGWKSICNNVVARIKCKK